VHKEFVHPGQTVNQQFCLKVLKRLRDIVQKKRPEMWSIIDWFLHHDNAPAHTTLCVQQFLAKNNMTVIPYPPYSPDLMPCDFFLFPSMKNQMKRKHFVDVSEVSTYVTMCTYNFKKR
jgi:histone-lysine N-methyltransferase SETMAR